MDQIGNGHHFAQAQDCLLCGLVARGPIPLCATCANDLPRAPQRACPRCARPSPNGAACGACLRAPGHVDGVRAAYRYTYPLDRLVQDYKYGHRLALADAFGTALCAIAPQAQAIDLIVPLPLHPARLRARGSNQALELARPAALAFMVLYHLTQVVPGVLLGSVLFGRHGGFALLRAHRAQRRSDAASPVEPPGALPETAEP